MVAACAVVVSCSALLFVVSQGLGRPLGYRSESHASGYATCGRVTRPASYIDSSADMLLPSIELKPGRSEHCKLASLRICKELARHKHHTIRSLRDSIAHPTCPSRNKDTDDHDHHFAIRPDVQATLCVMS
jgi:hypothetical protein